MNVEGVVEPIAEREATPAAADRVWPSPAVAWYTVAVLTLAVVFEAIDRGIMALLIEQIKPDLGISDTQASLLMGLAFAMFSVLLGIPIARLTDRKSRRLIIGVGIAFWSAMTAACGLAQTYWQLFLARVGVGVGDATNGPATFSILSDTFPKEKLARATSVVSMGFMLGGAIASLVGAAVIHYTSIMPRIDWPLVGELRPWQLTFIIVGLPGVLVAMLLSTVREPKRKGLIRRGGGVSAPEAVPFKDVVKFLLDNWRTYGPIFLGLALKSIFSFGTGLWVPSLFIRTFGWTAPEIGFASGLIHLVISPLGLIFGGFFVEWLAKRGYHDAHMRVAIIASVGTLPFSILYPLMPTPALAIALLAVNGFVAVWGAGPGHAALQIITPNQMRGQVAAIYFFVFNFIGFGLGPLIIALFTDFVFGAMNIRYSMSLAAAILLPLSTLVIWYGLKHYRAAVLRAKSWE